MGQVGAWLKFTVLVELVFLRRDSGRIYRDCFRFFFRVDTVQSHALTFLSALDSCYKGRGVGRFFFKFKSCILMWACA